jgi:hypothetical protein
MRILAAALAAAAVALPCACGFDPAPLLQDYPTKVGATLAALGDAQVWPTQTALNLSASRWQYVGANITWVSGFLPGLLWMMGNQTGDVTFTKAAQQWTAGLAVEASDNSTHDVGFMVFNSFGNGVRYGGMGAGYDSVVLEAAHSLAERWSPVVNMIR